MYQLFLFIKLSTGLLALVSYNLFRPEDKPIVKKRSIDRPPILRILLKLTIDNAGELIPKPKTKLLLVFPNKERLYLG